MERNCLWDRGMAKAGRQSWEPIRFSNFGVSGGMEGSLPGNSATRPFENRSGLDLRCGRRFWNGIKLSEGVFCGIVRRIGSCSIELGVSNLWFRLEGAFVWIRWNDSSSNIEKALAWSSQISSCQRIKMVDEWGRKHEIVWGWEAVSSGVEAPLYEEHVLQVQQCNGDFI